MHFKILIKRPVAVYGNRVKVKTIQFNINNLTLRTNKFVVWKKRCVLHHSFVKVSERKNLDLTINSVFDDYPVGLIRKPRTVLSI